MNTAYVTHSRYPEHDLPGHPEHAGRIRAVWRRLDETKLTTRLNRLEADAAPIEMLRAVHRPEYLDLLYTIPHYEHTVRLDADTYACPTSYEIARLSAGGVIRAVQEVASSAASNGMALVRPPGHHAMPGRAMGFCLLGNIAIAARYAQQSHGMKRIMIVDYDVHHGNGTEAMFYDDPGVMFVSTHQYPFYPGTGAITDTGSGAGEGYNVNIPLSAGHGDGNFAALFERVVWPLARRYQPELILVSAGFDAHWSDPLAGMRLSLKGYDHLSRELRRMADELCGGKIVFVMEGGYDLNALAYGWCNVARALLGDNEMVDPIGPPDDKRAEPDIEPTIKRLKELHGL